MHSLFFEGLSLSMSVSPPSSFSMVYLSCQSNQEKIELENFSQIIALTTSAYFVWNVDDCGRRWKWLYSLTLSWTSSLNSLLFVCDGENLAALAIKASRDCLSWFGCTVYDWLLRSGTWWRTWKTYDMPRAVFCTAASKSWNPHGKFPFKVAESVVLQWPSRAPPTLLHLKCQRRWNR